MRSTAYKKQGAPDRRSPTQQKLILFTRVAPYTKSNRAPDRCSAHILLLLARASPRTKSKGAPDRCSTYLLLLSAYASPRTKSKRLHKYALQIIILLIKFSKVFVAQQVSSSMVWLYPKPHERVS
jgi:hypothetical protein